MRKLLLIGIGLFVFSCDSDSPTEPADTGFIDSVCGYDDFEYLGGRGDACETSSYTAEDIANMYCELVGYTSAIEYDEFTSTTQQNVLYWTGIIIHPTCDDIDSAALFIASENCPIISNLVCE